jgi:hypothetical protein
MDKNKQPRLAQSGLIPVIMMMMPVSAMAYLDPTTGSMLISAIVGLFASLVLAIKTYWYRIRAFFKRRFSQSNADVTPDTDADNGAT